MATSIRETVLEAMLAAMNGGAGKPATTSRTRVDALNAAELPAFNLFCVQETVELKGASTRLRKLQVRVEAMVEGPSPADALIDPLYVYAVNTLLNDAGVAALVHGIYESGVQWGTAPSYGDACVALIDFEVHYTTTNDPTVAGKQ